MFGLSLHLGGFFIKKREQPAFLGQNNCRLRYLAFSYSPDKKEAILEMGATKVVDSTNPDELAEIAGSLNFILNTTSVTLDWNSYLVVLVPKGKFHNVGAVLEPMAIPAFTLLTVEKSVSGSPLGSQALTKTMLEFCYRHNIHTITEEFPMSRVHDAIAHLESRKARYRIVLKN